MKPFTKSLFPFGRKPPLDNALADQVPTIPVFSLEVLPVRPKRRRTVLPETAVMRGLCYAALPSAMIWGGIIYLYFG